jgi:hypothetical protein
LSGSLGDCAVQDILKFAGVTLIIHISGDDNPAPEAGVFFKYFWMNPNFRHSNLTFLIDPPNEYFRKIREFDPFYHPYFAGSKSKYHMEPCCSAFFLRRLFNA